MATLSHILPGGYHRWDRKPGERAWYSHIERPVDGYYFSPPMLMGERYMLGGAISQIPDDDMTDYSCTTTVVAPWRILVEYAVNRVCPEVKRLWSTVFDEHGAVLACCHWTIYVPDPQPTTHQEWLDWCEDDSEDTIRMAEAMPPASAATGFEFAALWHIDTPPGINYSSQAVTAALNAGYAGLVRHGHAGARHFLVTDCPQLMTTFSCRPPVDFTLVPNHEAATLLKAYREAVLPVVRAACPSVIAGAVMQRELEASSRA